MAARSPGGPVPEVGPRGSNPRAEHKRPVNSKPRLVNPRRRQPTPAVPKLTHHRPKDQREPNPFKPDPRVKNPPKGLTTRKPLERRTRLGVGKGALRLGKPALRPPVKRQAHSFQVSTSGAVWEKKRRKPLRAQSQSEGAKERRRLDRIWSEKVKAIWGGCILTGETGEGYWPVDAHHCWDKSIRPEWRHDPANGLLLRRDLHNMCDTDPVFHEACQRVADECRAAADSRRPPVSRAEARAIIFEKAPHMRRYARAEED